MRPSRFLVVVFVLLALAFSFSSIGQTQTVQVLYYFNGTVGASPVNITLAQVRDGQLYGTTIAGGTYGQGAIFKISTSGHVTALHSFNGTDGSQPWAGLTLGTDGNFYGTTFLGGTQGYGVLFKMTPAGVLTVLHNFAFTTAGTDGALPFSPPIVASDGNFYGDTSFGGLNGAGTVYKFTPAGVYTVIYNYDLSEGAYSEYSPTQGSDGNLYVVALEGGNNECGSLIKISTSGTLLNTYLFDCASNGGNPQGSLLLASDGNYYGATFNGGSNSGGVVFKLSSNFAYTVVHDFGTITHDGLDASGGLIQATDGNLYGVAYYGGTFGYGALYDYSLAGAYGTVFDFSRKVDAQGQLEQHTNGLFYGVTTNGYGGHDLGSVYSFNVGLAPFITLVQYQGRTGSTAQILGQGLMGTTSVTFNGVPATNFTVVEDTYMTAIVPSGVTTGPVVVTTPGGPLTSNKNFRIIN
jgi:uncharacterized repeat protein (TIGR03803 family)